MHVDQKLKQIQRKILYFQEDFKKFEYAYNGAEDFITLIKDLEYLMQGETMIFNAIKIDINSHN